MRFESIGSSCEFGIVQRRFLAEPLGLLRWAAIAPESIIRAVESRFEGMADPNFTTVFELNGEFVIENSLYGIFGHTFTAANAEDSGKFRKAQLTRLKFLTQKLLDDFKSAEKIFVYAHEALTTVQCIKLHREIRTYGGHSCLLCVRLAAEGQQLGQIDEIEDGLYVAYTDQFSTIDVSSGRWYQLCSTVSDLWDKVEAS